MAVGDAAIASTALADQDDDVAVVLGLLNVGSVLGADGEGLGGSGDCVAHALSL